MQTNLVLWAKPTQENAVTTERTRRTVEAKTLDAKVENLARPRTGTLDGKKKEVEPNGQNAQVIALDLLQAVIPVIKEIVPPGTGENETLVFDADALTSEITQAIEQFVAGNKSAQTLLSARKGAEVDESCEFHRCGTDLLTNGSRPEFNGSRPILEGLSESVAEELGKVNVAKDLAPAIYEAIAKTLEANTGQRPPAYTGAKPANPDAGESGRSPIHSKVLATMLNQRIGEKIETGKGSGFNGTGQGRPNDPVVNLTGAKWNIAPVEGSGAKPIPDANGVKPTWTGDMRDWIQEPGTTSQSGIQFSTTNIAPVTTQIVLPASAYTTGSQAHSVIEQSVTQIVESIKSQPATSPETLAHLVSSLTNRKTEFYAQEVDLSGDSSNADELLTKGGKTGLLGHAQLDNTPSSNSDGQTPFGGNFGAEDDSAIAFGREQSDDPLADVVETVPSEATEIETMIAKPVGMDARDVKSAKNLSRDQVASLVSDRMTDVHQAIRDLSSARIGGQISIRMTPDDLGTIDIGVKMFGQKLDIDVNASDERVRTNLALHRNELIQSVESKGLSLGSLNVGQQDTADTQQQQKEQRFADRQDFARAHAMSHKESDSSIMQHRDRRSHMVGAVDYQA